MWKFWQRSEPAPSPRKRPPSEATLARIRAEKELEAIQAETPRWEALGRRLKAAHERNHFEEAFRSTLKGRHP